MIYMLQIIERNGIESIDPMQSSDVTVFVPSPSDAVSQISRCVRWDKAFKAIKNCFGAAKKIVGVTHNFRYLGSFVSSLAILAQSGKCDYAIAARALK